MKEIVEDKISAVMKDTEMWRFNVRVSRSGRITITIDLHGYNRVEAMDVINKVLDSMSGMNFQLDLIHGYNSGRVLRRMIMNELDNPRFESKHNYGSNRGETFIDVVS